MMNYRAKRNVGDIVKLPGCWFGSLAVVTAFHEQADPTLIDFEVVKANNEPHVRVGDKGQYIADYAEVVEAARPTRRSSLKDFLKKS